MVNGSPVIDNMYTKNPSVASTAGYLYFFIPNNTAVTSWINYFLLQSINKYYRFKTQLMKL